MDYQDPNQRQEPIDVSFHAVDEIPKKKRRGMMKIVAFGLACILVGGAVGCTAMSLMDGGSPTIRTGMRTPATINEVVVDTQNPLTPAEIYAGYVNSTVGITVDIVDTNVFGQTVQGAAAGSGFVITQDGYILTNYHVIANANSITVTFVDGKSYPATLVGGEQENDIAVIKINAKDLKPVTIGSSDKMRVGESVVAIGNPLGELTFSLTSGVISALNRSITMSDGTSMNMIQTDCAINSGNSGGALFNTYGEVIGIVSAKYSSPSSAMSGAASVEGLGFAIPMNDVKDMIADLIENGYVTGKPFLGISVKSVDASAQEYGIPQGAKVVAATPGLCATRAGIQEGDVITALGDTKITNTAELITAKNTYHAGDTVNFTVFREGKSLTIPVTLDEQNTKNSAAHDEYVAKKDEELQQQQQQQQEPQQGVNPWEYMWPFGGFGF
ncbi:MAG: trypsin-like peptidase domain-containing protein [Evtepia sp.]